MVCCFLQFMIWGTPKIEFLPWWFMAHLPNDHMDPWGPTIHLHYSGPDWKICGSWCDASSRLLWLGPGTGRGMCRSICQWIRWENALKPWNKEVSWRIFPWILRNLTQTWSTSNLHLSSQDADDPQMIKGNQADQACVGLTWRGRGGRLGSCIVASPVHLCQTHKHTHTNTQTHRNTHTHRLEHLEDARCRKSAADWFAECMLGILFVSAPCSVYYVLVDFLFFSCAPPKIPVSNVGQVRVLLNGWLRH